MRRLSLLATFVLCLGLADPAGATPLIRDDGSAAVPAIASTSATWTPTTSGPPVIWDAVAFAGSTCRLVTFGGTDGYVRPTATNLFDPRTGNWTAIPKPSRGIWPVFRTLARMVWDPVRKRVIMFGGRDASGAALQDTWAFDPVAKTWTQLLAPCRKGRTCPLPPARYMHGMAWSSALGKVVVFGGEADMRTFLADTWTFDGTTWQRIATSGPSARAALGLAEDAATGALILFGGADWQGDLMPEPATWLLQPGSSTWAKLVTPTLPEMRAELGMAYVASIGAVVVTTGDSGAMLGTWTNSAYAFDMAAKDWRKLTTTGGPPTARNAANLTANLCDGSAILTGGTGDNRLPITLQDRTWILR